jgi:hypothetical protein
MRSASGQTGRAVAVSTPGMMTWGVADFVDEKTGESDGKFSMSLVFPSDGYETPATTEFLQKFKAFEDQILNDAVKNSEAWFGEEMSREVLKHTFFPALKYSKDKLTKKVDPNKPPSIRAKVPNYGGKWGVQIYDTNPTPNMMFPCHDVTKTPMDFIHKKSTVREKGRLTPAAIPASLQLWSFYWLFKSSHLGLTRHTP